MIMKKTYKFELPQSKEVEKTNIRVEDGKILVDVEFKEKFCPKDGDFLVSSYGKVFIYSDRPSQDKLVYSAYCAVDRIDNIHTEFSNNWTKKEGCRLATEAEKSAFLDRLEKEHHKKWNAETKTLEEIYLPKPGDIVKVICTTAGLLRNYMICIIPNKPVPDYSYPNFYDIANVTKNAELKYECSYNPDQRIIPASESEKQELFSKLEKVGKKWNPETKKLEDIKWQPKEHEIYYYIDTDGTVDFTNFLNTCSSDRGNVKIGNCFRTEEDAKPYANKIKQIFKNSDTE